jgi:hypothetical protein
MSQADVPFVPAMASRQPGERGPPAGRRSALRPACAARQPQPTRLPRALSV